MNLNQKVAAVVVGVFSVFALADIAVQRSIILPSFERLERDAAVTDMQRAHAAMRRELDEISTIAADWGNWADSYRFAVDADPDFVAENLSPGTFEEAGLDVCAFVAPDGRTLWYANFDPVERYARRSAMFSGSSLDPAFPLRPAIADGARASGLIWTESGPMLIASAPILDGAGRGPHRGAVIMGRVLTDAVVEQLAAQTQLVLAVDELPRGQASPAPGSVDHTSIESTRDLNRVARDVPDLYGRPLVRLTVASPRAISAMGRDTVNFALATLLGAGLVMLAVLFLLLRAIVLRPIGRIELFSRSVADDDDLTRRLELNRRDEIGRLAEQLNLMVGSLAAARRQASDQSFDAGLAEMARGVLHNVGNALTPALVGAGSLQDAARRLPTADIELASSELSRPDLDPARRGDLLRFLALAGADMRQRASQLTENARVLAESLLAIQAILHEQSRFSRSAMVVERVDLGELVANALRVVAPAKLERLDINVDESLAAVGAQRLPRIAIEQVLQNLVINAAEAVRPGAHGLLRISAGIEQRAGVRMLSLSLSDDGAGISAEHLRELFRKRFSTKPAESNSGLGLHWCANVVGSFGGSIEAKSDGPQCGATFIVRLPLDEESPQSTLKDIAA